MPIQDTSYQLAPSSQARADAQISNPATPITATKSLEATQPVDPLKTANPDNGGITPATQTTEKPASFDVSSLSRGLKNFDIWVYNTMIAANKAQSSTDLTKWYGIDLGWYTAEEAQTGFQNTMSDPNDPNIIYWKILTRKSGGWDKTLQAKFIRDIQQVDMDKKQANSGAWVNPDLWLDRGSTMDLANLFTQSDILKNKKLNEAWDVDKFILAFNNFKTANAGLAAIPFDSRADAISWPLWSLKAALSPLVDKAISIDLAQNNWIKSKLFYELEASQKGLNDYMKIHKASKEDLGSLIQWYQKQNELYSVSYGAITWPNWYQQKSINAKGKLNASPIYKNFIETMIEVDPDMAPIMKKWQNDTTISKEEQAYLNKHLFGEWQVKEMLDLRQKMIDEKVPGAWDAFKPYQEFVDIKNSLNDTMADDLIQNSKSAPSSMTLKSLSFGVNTWY